MAIYTDYVGKVMLADVVDAVNNSSIILMNGNLVRRHKYYSAPWEPPCYTSLRGWYLLNYSFVALVVAGLGDITYIMLKLI